MRYGLMRHGLLGSQMTVAMVLWLSLGGGFAEPAAPPAATDSGMNNAKLDALIRKLDSAVIGRLGYWQFKVEEELVTVITDEKADRMRIIVPIAKVDDLEPAILKRLLQANFDTALDARYAIAKGVVWSAYIHPLSPLQDKTFLEALGQVVNLKLTFGGSYSSGVLIFRDGDSEQLQRRKLIDELLRRGLAT